MTSRTSRLAGLLLTGLLLAAFIVVWQPGREPEPWEEPVPRHGGRLIAAIRTLPPALTPLADDSDTTRLVRILTQGTLVRLNRATFELEPWLASHWTSSSDGRSHTLHLRQDVTWSDGAPFTSSDVLFSLQTVFDRRAQHALAGVLTAPGGAVQADAPDPHTVVLTLARPSGAWLQQLDALPILPRHHLETASRTGTLPPVGDEAAESSPVPGLGPFVLRDVGARRIVLERNVRYWRTTADGERLPYLDEIVLELVEDASEETGRLEAGDLDVAAGRIRLEDYHRFRQRELQGNLTLVDLGVDLEADALWFCLRPGARRGDPAFAFVQRREFRQALSHAIDREAFAHVVFAGHAVPIWGPVTPGNRAWFSPNVPRYPPDRDRARELLGAIGLLDRTGDGLVEDDRGVQARFTVITERGVPEYERATAVLVEEARAVGIAFDVEFVETDVMARRVGSCDYAAAYGRPPAGGVDPVANLGPWLSTGAAHVWNPAQLAGATEWERRIDTLMIEQAATTDPARRREIFDTVQRILGEEVPMLYFAAPRAYTVHHRRVLGVTPAVTWPPVLWSADTLAVAPAPNRRENVGASDDNRAEPVYNWGLSWPANASRGVFRQSRNSENDQ